MNNRTLGILNSAFVQKYRCATCWGALTEKIVDGQQKIVCPRNCQPGGFVTVEYVEAGRARDRQDYLDVLHNYPQFAPHIDIEAASVALFGEE